VEEESNLSNGLPKRFFATCFEMDLPEKIKIPSFKRIFQTGGPQRDRPRTWDRLLKKLMEHFNSNPNPMVNMGSEKDSMKAVYQERAA
jgi:hypothetical protein